MSTFSYTVIVTTDTQEHANEVMAARLGHDEDYGFDYALDWKPNFSDPRPTVSSVRNAFQAISDVKSRPLSEALYRAKALDIYRDATVLLAAHENGSALTDDEVSELQEIQRNVSRDVFGIA